jgi:hypothetical protein
VPPLLFGFRGIRMFQVILSFAALLTGVGAVVTLKLFVDDRAWWTLLISGTLTLVFFWLFQTTLKAPTSLVAVDFDKGRTRIRFAGFIDRIIDNRDVAEVRIRRRTILGGIGVRTNFAGDVALVSAWGDVAEITLRNPIRVWLIPRLIPLKASRLTLSIRNPQKLVEGFSGAAATAPRQASPARPVATKRRSRR